VRKNIVSQYVEELCNLATELHSKHYLQKIVLSKPMSDDEIKSVLTLKMVSGNTVIQVETFSKDNKVYHMNIKDNFHDEFRDLFYRYYQINIFSSAGNCQYMKSAKKGTETIVGNRGIWQNIRLGKGTEVQAQLNNRQKQHILQGGEEFLKKLGISDDSGRVRDRMQAKYRQINKFLEHVESIIDKLPENNINIYDLCCGKSYLSFAVYHYFTIVKKKKIKMVCIDLKHDVIEYCSNLASRIGFNGMEFLCMDINDYSMEDKPDLVISLHACDIATDIVLNKASDNGAKVILSTPCCHHELNHKIKCDALKFITDHSMLRQKLCDAATDALRILKLQSEGYEAVAMELIDPEDTPKNIIIKAIKKSNPNEEKLLEYKNRYIEARKYLLGEEK